MLCVCLHFWVSMWLNSEMCGLFLQVSFLPNTHKLCVGSLRGFRINLWAINFLVNWSCIWWFQTCSAPLNAMSLFSQGPVDVSVDKRLLYKKSKFFYNALLYYHTQITKSHIILGVGILFQSMTQSLWIIKG